MKDMKRRRRISRISHGLFTFAPIFLMLIFLLTVFPFYVSVSAQPATTVSIGDVCVMTDTCVTMPIMVNNVTNLGAGRINIAYNPSVVHITEVASGTGNALTVTAFNISNSTGLVQIFAKDEYAPHNGNVILANVTYNAVASTGSTPLNIIVRELIEFDYPYPYIPHTVSNGTFTIIAQPTPFFICGYVFYGNNSYSACNGPRVNITNLNTGEKWQAETNTAHNYYQLVLHKGTDVNKGEILRFDATNPDGNQSDAINHTVTSEEIDRGRLFYFNISLKPNIFDTGPSTHPYPSIMGVHRGSFTPKRNITVHQIYTYPCAGTGGHSEYVAFYDYEKGEEIANASWNGYKGDYHNISFKTHFTLYAGIIYTYEIRTGSYPQIIHRPGYENDFGTITCDEFTDANGRVYNDWIPAIRLFH